MPFQRISILVLLALLAGCSSEPAEQGERPDTRPSPETRPVIIEQTGGIKPPDDPIMLTDKSENALRKMAKDGKGPWVVFYQGLCDGKPSLGMYEAKVNPPQGGTTWSDGDIEFILDTDMPGLIEKHGQILIEGPVNEDGNFMVTFPGLK
jgi:hypothetical protein